MRASLSHHITPGPSRPLATKIGIIGCLVLLLSLLAIGLTLWITWQMQGGAAAVNEAGRMRMQTWRMAQMLSGEPVPQLPALLAQFDRSLGLLRQGDPARPLAVPRDGSSRQALQAVEANWAALRDQWAQAAEPGRTWDGDTGPDTWAVQADAFVADIDRLVDSIEKQLERWTTWLNMAQFVMMALVVVTAVALLYAAQLWILGPLSRLQAGLARIEAGDLKAHLDERGNDEFAAVAVGFNRMARHLQHLYASLEQRVASKTRHLETERARLAILYEAAAFASTAGTLEALARGFAAQIRRAARADGVAIRWSDEHNLRYVMLASEGLPDDLVAAEHCIPTGSCHCGQPQSQAQIRAVPLVTLAGGPPARPVMAGGQCLRAGFSGVINVPMRLHERVVGEIDLFFRAFPDFNGHDRSLVDTLASHLAGGIEGLRVEALQRESAVAEERSLLARELHDSIAQGLSFLKIQAGLLRERLGPVPEGPLRATLDELDTGIRESLSDVRELLVHFRTRTSGEDIAPALQTTLTKFEHQTGLAAHLDIEGEGLPLPPDVQIQVLHVVQEALSNVRKHARANQVWVDVQQSPQWVVSVRDDGCGLREAASAQDETHVGLRIMRERAASIGARLDIASAADAGTCVTLTLPSLLPNT